MIRGGGGIYYDVFNINIMLDEERNALGPRGTGRTNYQHTRIPNPVPNLSGVPLAIPFNFTNPTLFTGTHLMTILPALRADLLQRRGDTTNRDIGEVFNVLNIANLSGHSGNLANAATFGQPTSRVDQVFGSGGPRAFQLGVRVSF